MKTAHFELFRDAAGQYRFRLKAANGEIVMSSEGYTTEAGRYRAIGDLLAVAEQATDDSGEPITRDAP